MECLLCKGKMEKGTTSYSVNRKGYHLVIDNVPAYICHQCHEPYFEEKGIHSIQRLIRDLDQKTEELQVASL